MDSERAPARLAEAEEAKAVGGRLSGVEAWLAARRRIVVFALVVLSIAVRAVCFAQFSAGPWLALHRGDQTDMHYFHQWGQAIAGGDWLSRTIGPPTHLWHERVAEEYFARHPEARSALEQQARADGSSRTAAQQLWWQWNGRHQFYQDPLYAYLVGATYMLFGSDPRTVLAWQMALGVLTNVLIYLIARRYFGDLTAAIAAGLALACSPLMYYEMLLLRDSTIACAGLAIVWAVDRAITRGGWQPFALTGALLGLAIPLKSSFVLVALVVAGGLAWHIRRQPRRAAWLPLAAFVGAGAVVFMPFAARNMALGVPPLALAGSGTLTFVVANDVTYPATGGFVIDNARLAEILGDTNGRPIAAALDTLGGHTISSYAAVLWHKFANVWHWYEIPNNDNFYYLRLHVPILRWLPITFFVLAPLGLAGLVLAGRRWRDRWPLYALVVSSVVSLTAFLVLGRLRVALVAAVIPFAAHTIVACARSGSRRALAIAAVVLLTGAWTGRPLAAGQPLIALTDWLTPFAVQYQGEIKEALDANDAARAAAGYLAFLRYEPDFEPMIGGDGALSTEEDREVARTFAQIHMACASLLNQAGRPDEASRETRRAETLAKIAAGEPNH